MANKLEISVIAGKIVECDDNANSAREPTITILAMRASITLVAPCFASGG